MLSKRQISVIWIGILLAMFAAGCKKKVRHRHHRRRRRPSEKPPAPPPKKPTITQFTAEPSSIERGQSATLRWSVEDANDISIDQGIGTVQANGSRRVFPTDSTTYTLTATGPGGTETATATVNVTAPPPPPPPPAAPKPTLSEMLDEPACRMRTSTYDKSDIREDARARSPRDADALKNIFSDFPNATVVVEGHCDERGSAEYNLGLGDRRATSAKDFLVNLGVPPTG